MRGLIRVPRHLVRSATAYERLTEERLSGLHIPRLAQVEVHRLAGLVHRPVQIHPTALDLEIGFVPPAPSGPRGAPMSSSAARSGDKASAPEACLTAWVSTLATPGEQEGVAIDGKAVRHSFDRGRKPSPLHRVSAWASTQGWVWGQPRGDDQSNEITALPERRESLALENTRVTNGYHGAARRTWPSAWWKGGLSAGAQGPS
jgi:hypothetical protein